MQTDDIVVFFDERFARHRFWKIVGIHLGCVGQEGLIVLECLNEEPGFIAGEGEFKQTYVPEPLLRNAHIYTPLKPLEQLRQENNQLRRDGHALALENHRLMERITKGIPETGAQ